MTSSWRHLYTLFNSFIILWNYKFHQTSTECFNIFWLIHLRMTKNSAVSFCPVYCYFVRRGDVRPPRTPVPSGMVSSASEENIARWLIDPTVAQ